MKKDSFLAWYEEEYGTFNPAQTSEIFNITELEDAFKAGRGYRQESLLVTDLKKLVYNFTAPNSGLDHVSIISGRSPREIFFDRFNEILRKYELNGDTTEEA